MSGYVRDVIVKRQWQGDNVTVVLAPIGYADMLGMGQYFKGGKASVSADQVPDLIGRMKTSTRKLDGLKAHDTSEVTIDELYGSAYFLDLVMDVLGEWLNAATPANPPSPGA